MKKLFVWLATGVGILIAVSLPGPPFNIHSLRPWEPIGTWILNDSLGKPYTVSVSKRELVAIPDDKPDIRFVMDSDTTRFVVTKRLNWFRFGIDGVIVKDNVLYIFHRGHGKYIGASFKVQTDAPQFTSLGRTDVVTNVFDFRESNEQLMGEIFD